MEQTEWELLGESPRNEVNRLIEFYKKDKAKARIIYHQDKTKYHYSRIVLFNKPNGDFHIVNFLVTYGISSSGIIYHRQRRYSSIICKDKKLYTTNGAKGPKNFTQLNFFGLEQFVSGMYHVDRSVKDKVKKIMYDKYSWLRWIEENEDLHDMCFNTILKKKLKNPNDCIRYRYDVPLNIAKIVQTGNDTNHGGYKGNIKIWKEMKKVLDGIQNLKLELFEHPLFLDTCKMAAALGRKVNCSWGSKRLKEEHDKWSKEITKTVLEYAELQKLAVAKLYLGFASFSGYKILRTNKEMMYEGTKQNHCVATYISEVDRGACGIYHINGYTLQLKEPSNWGRTSVYAGRPNDLGGYDNEAMQLPKSKKLVINQFKGFRNQEAPKELYTEVQKKLDEFSLLESFEEFLKDIPEVPDDFNLSDVDMTGNVILTNRAIQEIINEEQLPF